jgi:hypothetical protein
MVMTEDFRFLSAVADQLLLERGEYDPFEFLLSAGYLDDEDYREWRQGRSDELQSALLCDAEEAIVVLAQIQTYVLKQKLTVETRAATSWEKESRVLRIGSSKALTQLCNTYLVRPTERMQADLFQDSTQTVATHAVRTALAEHRLQEAHEVLARLQKLVGNTTDVKGYQQLLSLVESSAPTPADRLHEIETVIAPLAARFLAQRARDYLAPLWQALARRLSKAAFDPQQPKLHASYANAQARRWKRVVEVIEAEQSWEQHATLMTRFAEAYTRLSRKPEARRVWSRLCWQHPAAASGAIANSQDATLANRWHEFIETDAELEMQDFPAWLLIADLRQREYVPTDIAPDNDVGRAYVATFNLVIGDGAMSARAALNELRPVLLQQYLARRRVSA